MELQEAKEALDSHYPHKESASLRLVIHQPRGIRKLRAELDRYQNKGSEQC
ncbi:Uncharacterised protein [Escherichia coli]|uniref:Uncharacterized protein n=1 Tax=Escherichia coli HVH 36 (4-5675286) TaxID=1280986 RepID=A0A7U9IT54_ECOLX|nr:hypothetical protein [Salmonella enterica subsp. enterica]EDR7498234.1 hypothetical protein [Salmonella enterica subsp. enterica serovar Kiambu]EDW8204718.1 hypothetical protein [Salmonella enterica subsp. enterica serovar Indiana]EEJ2250103.1 hypothetical protein [Salmonella enterica subsp. enterica serovar Thompson]ESP05740.1 hypothetical protein G711_05089 [Escherichia coli HVH 36 (4-5675286)]CTS38343.1 Uncharacterised protein [Escherichia coli]SAE49735.1 Uncharacterised protein [Entero